MCTAVMLKRVQGIRTSGHNKEGLRHPTRGAVRALRAISDSNRGRVLRRLQLTRVRI